MTARTAAYWLLFSFTRNLCEKTDLFRVALRIFDRRERQTCSLPEISEPLTLRASKHA